MKNLLKTVLFLLLCALLSLPALAEEEKELTCGDYTYALLEDGAARITDYDGKDAELTVPAELDGHAVREIGEEAFHFCDMTSVTLPEGLTSIGDDAFNWCDSLTNIMLPDGLTSIGNYAFYGCFSLTAVTLPDSLTSIGISAFANCSSLTTITLPDGLTSIGYLAFANCSSLTSITLPDSLTSIGDYAFDDCEALTSILLPDSLTSIGDEAFVGCDNLTLIVSRDSYACQYAIENGLSYVYTDDNALSALTKGVEKEELTCGDYTYVLLEDGGARITGYDGMDAKLTVPAELDGHPVREIGKYAFFFCKSLTTVTLPDSLTSIGANPFSSCSKLEKIGVSPDSPVFAQIDGVLYEKATKTLVCYPAGKASDSFAVPDGILAIGDSAFYSCSSLTTITLSDSLTSIGDSAFYGCGSLTAVTLPDGLTSIDDDAFSDCSTLTTITLPDSLTYIGANPFRGCYSLAKIDIISDHPVFEQIDGVLYEKAIKTLICYPAGKEGDSFAVPDGILAIGDSAFFSCKFLTTVTLPDSLTSIGEGAFEFCSDDLTLTVPRDSYAYQYAIDNGLSYTYPDVNNWLNA